MNQRHFGKLLRTVRERRQMTLREVAGKAGVSESLISQIERDKVSPSIDTLLNITETLGIHPEYLFRGMEPKGAVSLTRGGEGAMLQDGKITYRSMAHHGTGEERVEVFSLEIEPGGSRGGIEYGHRGYEIGVILEGKAVLYYGDERLEVGKGDSLTFESSIPHTLQNPGPERLVSLWFVSPSRLFTS
ncbi:MAG: helix-turn-helix transcriptional regulator [Spirochaetales bacterium]|nr:helix-turn-helix transcriptional regulator [Spirochaetales bacterium]